ncbi:ATP-binding protein [Streptomyces sp. NPDC015127]|uniref:ATP-binding protein n=1 Tax=Streptomyces sp. NPDC015127 TaxID=3364939 RepID=UPI0036FAFFA0
MTPSTRPAKPGPFLESGNTISEGALAVSELVANAHEHACGPYEMHLRSFGGRYVCEIHDGEPLLPADLYVAAVPSANAEPVEGVSGLLAERGRGLRIVNELARGQWGFLVTECGTKAAWVVLAAGSAATPPDGTHRDRLCADWASNGDAGAER